ncbi:MAG TPA: cyclic nucleotide-binding domain-containing protein, partial [Bacteroidota bacterium]|nr:cyclic nucleotide-binding domain-containing protein [Bacteroidota bacterium]
MELGQTQLKRIEQYKDRWTSYGANTGILELSEKPTPQLLKQFDIFKEYDDKFLEKISPDISIALWKDGTVLFEEGSYIDIAFYIVSGTVDVYLQKQQAPAPIFARGRTQVISGQQPGGKGGGSQPQRTMYRSGEVRRGGREITFLASMDFDLPTGTTLKLGAGDVFGEIGALNGWPQSATAKTTSTCQLVQIRTAALRLMRKRSAGLKARLDKLYKERTLNAHLRSTPMFQGVSESFLQALVQKVELVSCEPGDVIATEGSSADAVYLIRSGFVRLSQQYAGGSIVVSYLSKGNLLGEAEFLLNTDGRWLFTATSQEYSELVKISRDDFRSVLSEQPEVEALLWEAVAARIKESGYSRRNINQSEFIARALDNGLVEGNSILVIDL